MLPSSSKAATLVTVLSLGLFAVITGLSLAAPSRPTEAAAAPAPQAISRTATEMEIPARMYPSADAPIPSRIPAPPPEELAEVAPSRQVFLVPDLDAPPRLVNGSFLTRTMRRLYARVESNRNGGGRVVVEFIVGTSGTVETRSIRILESSNPAFNEVTVDLVALMEFTPGLRNRQPVRTLIQMPVSWQPETTSD